MSKLERFKPMTRDERESIAQAILADCDVVDGHWIYRYANAEGYGVRRIAGASRSVCRFMLAHASGLDMRAVKQDVEACHDDHRCRNRACCRPKCLYWGTKAENRLDTERSKREDGALVTWCKVELTRLTLKHIAESRVDSNLFANVDSSLFGITPNQL